MEKSRLTPEQLLRFLRARTRILEKMEPPVSTPHIAIGYNYEQFRTWARQYGVSPNSVRFVSELYQMEGLGDYILVVFPNARVPAAILDRLYRDSQRVYDTRYDYPTAEKGKIIRWNAFRKPTYAE